MIGPVPGPNSMIGPLPCGSTARAIIRARNRPEGETAPVSLGLSNQVLMKRASSARRSSIRETERSPRGGREDWLRKRWHLAAGKMVRGKAAPWPVLRRFRWYESDPWRSTEFSWRRVIPTRSQRLLMCQLYDPRQESVISCERAPRVGQMPARRPTTGIPLYRRGRSRRFRSVAKVFRRDDGAADLM